jgi:hypothetical protein
MCKSKPSCILWDDHDESIHVYAQEELEVETLRRDLAAVTASRDQLIGDLHAVSQDYTDALAAPADRGGK